jgi:NAD(P)-dependent dehydrogenase (short-subunit alcohol dehydrogenase family)
MRLAGKVAIISGAASGMGAATARMFAREGAKVVIADVLQHEGRGKWPTPSAPRRGLNRLM